VRLQDRVGRRVVVLYFYPKDETSGCTAEAYVIDRGGTVRHVFNSMTNIDRHVKDALAVVQHLRRLAVETLRRGTWKEVADCPCRGVPVMPAASGA
jgi:peroxiredoxin